jgi:cytochrome bd ubiquinol oxidase subunit I
MDPILLARIQFGANISFHILFPTITIALGWVLLFFKVAFNRSGNEKWMNAYRFWVKVFALSFALGVVSGITMSFQFGTNWPGFMERVGNIAGPLLAYEVLTAFFLEATFLGIMLFGFRKVPNWMHTLATFLVAFGTTMSAFWILVLNSWMHTPAGFELRDGVAFATDWWAIIFNPSMPYRLAHMLLASGLTCAFLIAGLSAFRWLRQDRGPDVMAALRTGVAIGAVLIPVQIFVGDLHGLNTLQHQPAKVAAMEGNWETKGHVPLLLFALPNEATRSNDFEIGIPGGASLILKHEFAGVVPGLNDFVAPDGTRLHPPVAPVFFAFRIMVGIGMLMLAVSWFAGWQLWRKRRYRGAARVGACRHDLRRLGRHPVRLVCDGDRPPTLACVRRADHGAGGIDGAGRDDCRHAGHVSCHLCDPDRSLHLRAVPSGRQGTEGCRLANRARVSPKVVHRSIRLARPPRTSEQRSCSAFLTAIRCR